MIIIHCYYVKKVERLKVLLKTTQRILLVTKSSCLSQQILEPLLLIYFLQLEKQQLVDRKRIVVLHRLRQVEEPCQTVSK